MAERSNEQRIDELRSWFDQWGWELAIHKVGDEWRAPFMPKGPRIANVSYGVRETAIQAAEDAKARFERRPHAIFVSDKSRDGEWVPIDATAGEAHASAALPNVVIEPPSLVHERALGIPTVKQTAPVPDIDRKLKTLTGHGWGVWFESEPNGKVTGLLLAYELNEVLKSSLGDDFEDAWLGLGIVTKLPSDEVRQERNRRS